VAAKAISVVASEINTTQYGAAYASAAAGNIKLAASCESLAAMAAAMAKAIRRYQSTRTARHRGAAWHHQRISKKISVYQ